MSARCWRAQSLLAQRSAGLADADRLVLEEHLSACAACDGDAMLLDRMCAAARGSDGELSPQARRRIVSRSLSPRSVGPSRSTRPRSPRIAMSVALAAALASLSVAVIALGRRDAPLHASVGLQQAARDRVAGLPPSSRDPAMQTGQQVEATRGTIMDLDGARVEILETSTLQWTEADATLELSAGAVLVDVAPRTGRPLRVVTPRFVVEVIGTSFEVSHDGVQVKSGRVRVVSGAGGEIVAEVAAGQSWTLRDPSKRPVAPDDIDGRIADARRRLAGGRAAEARAILERVLGRSLGRKQQAEARSLLAECALVEGDYGKAARVYGEVAASQADTLAGETALFAQARAQMRAGQRREARQTLTRYVQRFPQGRFHKEALDHLRTLGGEP